MSYLVVGLGNPGEKYTRSRHNTGFMVLDALAEQVEWEKDSTGKLLYAWEKFGKHKVELLKPLTFMNKSGLAVLVAQKKHNVKPEHIIVVHDDVDLPIGKIKIVQGRGSGGHNGVRSVQRSLKTKEFIRVRVGVTPTTPTGKLKKPKGEERVLKHLMGDFKKADEKKLKSAINQSVEAIELIITEGIVFAMNTFN